MSLTKLVLRNSIFKSVNMLTTKIAGLVITIILARVLLPDLFGVYSLTLSLALIIVTIADMGISTAGNRYVPWALGKNRQDLARAYYRYLFKLKFILAAIFSIVFYLLAPTLAFIFDNNLLISAIQIASLYVFLTSIMKFFDITFFSVQRLKYSVISITIYDVLRVIFIWFFLTSGYLVFGAFLALILALMFATIISAYFVFTRYSFLFKGETPKIRKGPLLKFIFFINIASISTIFFINTDIIMIGMFLSTTQVGYYKVGFTLVAAIAGLLSLSAVLLPVFSQLEGGKLKRVYQKVFRYSIMFSFPIAFGVAHFSSPFIKIFYGSEYLLAIPALVILSFLIIEHANTQFLTSLFIAKKQPQWPTYIILVSMGINIILNYILILAYGIIGAAIATIISRYFNFIMLGFFSKIKLGILPKASTIWKPAVASVIMAVVLLLIPRPETVLVGIVEIILGAAVYFAVLYSLKGFRKEDIEILTKFYR